MEKEKKLITLGVDLGGTKVETGVVDGEGRVLASHRHATDPARGADEIIASIVACVKEPTPGRILPAPFNRSVAVQVATAVREAAEASGVCRN